MMQMKPEHNKSSVQRKIEKNKQKLHLLTHANTEQKIQRYCCSSDDEFGRNHEKKFSRCSDCTEVSYAV